MTDERNLGERERRIRESIRSTADVRADTAFRDRLKQRFVDGTISGPAVSPEPRASGLPRWWWIPAPAAAVVLLLALFLPRPAPAPSWAVQAVHGEGRVEIDGQVLEADEPALVARVLGAAGRVRTLEEVSLDLRLDDRLLLALDEGTDVTLPVLEGAAEGPLISEVHHGELRIKTGPGFPGTELHILTTEGRTEIVGTIISVYKADGYTCVCVLEGTARIGVDEARLEEVPQGMLKVMFGDGRPSIVAPISSKHEADLLEFGERYRSLFPQQE